MKNYEKYAEKIRGYDDKDFCKDFVKPYILGTDHCNGIDCIRCSVLRALWLLEDYEEPEVDWSKVEVDTPILVRDSENTEWERRYFAKYKNGIVYAWNSGCTSWTTHRMTACMTPWIYAKLAEDEKEYKEPEVDWNKVEVDTPILVKDYEDAKWSKRHFAKYENGIIYAWQAGCTSQSIAVHMSKWKYAKLAENEE